MANNKISGVTFNGITIDNRDIKGDYKLLDVERPLKPNLTFYDFSVPYRNGSRRVDNRYEDIPINVKIGIRGTNKREKITQLLQNWIGRESKLFFSDRPTLFYFAKIYGEITEEQNGVFTVITIPFICSYCLYEKYDDLRDYTVDQLAGFTVDSLDGILVNRQLWDSITSNQVKQITNNGNYKTKPIVEIQGTATTLQMQIGNVAFSLSNIANETIYVDSEYMIVYKYVNGEKQSVLTRFMGGFPKIPIGTTDVSITGTNLNLNITVDYKNTYIV